MYRLRCLLTVEFFPSVCHSLLLLLMDKSESKGTKTVGGTSKKLDAVSTDGKRPSKAARTGAPSDTRCL